jgi:hypothetical protein
VIQLLPDANIVGHVARLTGLMQTDYWRELWDHLDIRACSFNDFGLSSDDTDERVWQVCQQHQLYLLTSNRNDDGPDSLAATIRTQGTATSLPVFTLSDAEEVFRSKAYADRIVESLFDYLLRIEEMNGSGRIFLP